MMFLKVLFKAVVILYKNLNKPKIFFSLKINKKKRTYSTSKLNLFVISELCIVRFYHLIQYVMHILY